MSLAAKAPEERRRRILMAAVDVLRERGYSGTRVVDIADAAGTSSGLVLYHFKSLEGVLAQALTTLEDDFYEGLGRDLQATSGPVQRLRHMGELGAGAGPAVGDWSLWLEITGMNSAQSLIWRRIFWSQASPPRSSLMSNHTSMPKARRASAIRRAASASSRA